jgi:C_GCAxxG_C_C family probable redox protein
MSKAEVAEATFKKGFNCAQAVLSAYSYDFGMDTSLAFKVAGGFGGGVGHMGETCGAVTGAFMVIGLKYGMTVADGWQSHRDAFGKVQEFAREFKVCHGSIVCRELLGFDINDQAAFREARKNGTMMRICPVLVHDAAEITEKLLAVQPAPTG